MGLNLNDVINGLDPARRRKIEDRAVKLIAEEMTLRELRKAHQPALASVAGELVISQDGVSRFEKRTDLLLSTLRKTVEAMGGRLSLIATFPDRPPVELSGNRWMANQQFISKTCPSTKPRQSARGW